MQASSSGPAVKTYVARRTTRGPGFYLTFLLFFISVIVAVGLFAYTKVIESTIDDKIAQIEKVQAQFDPAVMKELIRVDTRMRLAQQVLEEHVTVTEYFRLLEQVTVRPVRYESMSFTIPEARASRGRSAAPQPTDPSVVLAGQARDFKQIALQADEYNDSADIKQPVVAGLNINEADLAVFNVTMNVDPRLISYTDAIRSGRRVIDTTGGSATVPVVPTPEPVEETATTSEPQATEQ
jgi:hypothetical protein